MADKKAKEKNREERSIIHESTVSQSYEGDMVKYSIIVNRRRALPEDRDSLKPVQRRVLFDMFEQHATSYGKRIKSSAIVGDTMKKYHPHGDCLSGDTKVYGLDGKIYNIAELYENGIDELHILSVDQNTQKVIPAIATNFRIGQFTNEIYHIVLSNGSEIKCTSNHPIMMNNGEFVKAEFIKPGMIPYRRPMVISHGVGRPIIDGNLIQDLVFNHYYDSVQEGYIKHHKDHNYFNNRPDNFDVSTRSDHSLHHDDFNTGLELGRQSMFDPKGKDRIKTLVENSRLARIMNKDQGIRRFLYHINLLRASGLEITIDNYELLRSSSYNLPRVDKLIEKGYGNSFEELVNYQIKSVGEIYEELYGDIIIEEPIYELSGEIPIIQTHYDAHMKNIFDKFDQILLEFGRLNYDLYRCKSQRPIDEYKFEFYKNIYYFINPIIINVWIEKVTNEPMYDFTVHGTENMLIPVGNINGEFIPMICVHNSSIYGTMEPLANFFKCKVPLIAPKGNWGTVMGDDPAAMRYTEAGLSDFCFECVIGELKDSPNVVDWIPTFDRKTKEPEFLPVKVPLLLVNGSFGIGVGMTVSIPPHNLVEVINETRKLIRDRNTEVVLVPDHCLPCNIIDADWKKISNSGSGSYRVRGIVDITEYDKHPALIVRSLPDRVSTNVIVDKLNEMIEKKQLPMIKDIMDASANGVVEIIIQLRKGTDPYYVREVLYTKTKVQDTVSVNFMVVHGTDPKRMSYKEYLLQFLEMRATTKFRLYCNKLQICLTRYHQLIAYIKILESGEIDNIINMVRKQNLVDDDYLIEYLIKKTGVTDLQAKYILNTDIRRLSKGYLNKYKEEFKQLEIEQAIYERAVTDDGSIIMSEIDKELEEIAKKYGRPRTCKVIKVSDDSNIPRGTFKVVITEGNYVRKIPDTDKVGIVKKDNPKFILRVDNAENILIFDNKGKVFKLPVYKIPVTDRNSLGTDIRVLQKNLTADIISVIYEPVLKKIAEGPRKHYLTVVSKLNSIKKLDIEDFLNVNVSGLLYSKVTPEDEIADVALVPIDFDVIIYSGRKALRVPTKSLPLFKRNASGSKAMNTKDMIEGLSVIYPDADNIIVITNKGKINRFLPQGMAVSERAKGGASVIKLDPGDSIFSIYGANKNDIIRVVTSDGIQEIPVSSVPLYASTAKGTKMINVKTCNIIRTDIIKGINQ